MKKTTKRQEPIKRVQEAGRFNPLRPSINMHILLSVLVIIICYGNSTEHLLEQFIFGDTSNFLYSHDLHV